ncbi:BOBBER 1-like protein [Tanacetum coccineum]
MAILSEYEEQPESIKKPFNAVVDTAEPLKFLEKAFDFVAKETDLFKNESVVKDVNRLVRSVKEKVEAEEKKRKEKSNGAGLKVDNKRVKEETSSSSAKEVKDQKMEEVKEDDNKGLRAPNSGNGQDMEKYSWVQSLQEVTVNVPIPHGTKSRFVACDIKKNHLKVGLNLGSILDMVEIFGQRVNLNRHFRKWKPEFEGAVE